MNHLVEAKRLAARAGQRDGVEENYFSAQLAIAHAAIAIAERLPLPTETWSEALVRVQKEKHNGL